MSRPVMERVVFVSLRFFLLRVKAVSAAPKMPLVPEILLNGSPVVGHFPQVVHQQQAHAVPVRKGFQLAHLPVIGAVGVLSLPLPAPRTFCRVSITMSPRVRMGVHVLLQLV